MTNTLNRLKNESLALQYIHTPEFFRLSDAGDKARFDELIARGDIFLSDEIHDQVKELVKSRNPSLNTTDYSELIAKHIGDKPADEFGIWVYYPWSRRIVHILDKDEFIELRTSANKNKITIAERDLLATKKVGVIGLSVGQSVSLTLAMERGCGELRLADFDTLELNNLNRIRTGVHNLGIYKVYAVAREIAEIDPYFKVLCFKEGINDDNIDEFFTGGGTLDAVIDECDSVNIKIQCRLKAKELQIPVLMEASDRGTLDVERFDLHPERPIMHGWLEHLTLDLNVLKNLKTNDEKVPYMLPISGLDTLSPRMKASMLEMRMTITTWPQLATAVTLGGAITADTCRRMFLNQFTDSGRYFIDLETIVPDKRNKDDYKPVVVADLFPEDVKQIAEGALKHLPQANVEISEADLNIIITAAVKAPSKGNSQPWLWHKQGNYVFLFLNENNGASYTDFRQMAAYTALGAALENLQIAAAVKGLGAEISYFPMSGEPRLVAAIAFSRAANQFFHDPVVLNDLIGKRRTNRNTGTGAVIDDSILDELMQAVKSVDSAELVIKSSREEIQEIAHIVGPAERLKLLNPESHFEFFEKKVQWAGSENGEGIPLSSLCLSTPEEIGLKMIRDPRAARLSAEWRGAQALQYTARKTLGTASAVGLITVPAVSELDFLAAGRAVERMWLMATKNVVEIYPIMFPLLYFNRIIHNEPLEMPAGMRDEMVGLCAGFEKIFPQRGRTNVFLFALSTAGKPVAQTPRKPLRETLI